MTHQARRALIFRLRGEFRSPLYRLLDERPGLTLTIRPTSVTPESATDIIRVRGAPADLEAVRALLGTTPPHESRVRVLARSFPGEVVFFQTCPRPTDGGVSLEHILLETLGRSATFEAEVTARQMRIAITAPAGSPLEACFAAYSAALSPRFRVELERLSHADEAAGSDLALTHEEILLDALDGGYFDTPRTAGVRDLALAAGRGKSAHVQTLRDAIAALARLDVHEADGQDALVFEYWGSLPRSAHYCALLTTPGVRARTEALQVTAERAWQVIVAEGEARALDALRAALASPAGGPIERLELLSDEAERVVYYDEWRRPDDPAEGVSLEHLLFDAVGAEGAMRTEFRHGVCRVTCIGPRAGLEAYWDQARPRLEARFQVARIGGPRLGRDALAAALATGHLDMPRRASIDDVARALGVAPSTAGVRLRVAIRDAIMRRVPGARARQLQTVLAP